MKKAVQVPSFRNRKKRERESREELKPAKTRHIHTK
jgi:hypothetical protein